MLIALGTYICFASRGELAAQTLTTLHDFAATGADGESPLGNLILSNNTLYGTTAYGGDFDVGTVFAMNTDGTGFRTIHSFSGTNDGAVPKAALTLSGQVLYGTTVYGGSSNWGTVFAVNTDGTGFTNLHSFDGQDDGGYPYSTLVLDGNTLYGTTTWGVGFPGTVFRINTDGSSFTNLYSFTGDSDGSTPWAGVILSGTTLYGTTGGGGNSFAGTVFAINTDGTGFTNLYSFTGGNDGERPNASLLFSTNVLYGTTELGGATPTNGVIFKLSSDGTGFKTLHIFSSGSYGSLGNLIISGGILYGTSFQGGASGFGTVFAINTDGTGFTNLYSFTKGKGPQAPTAGLLFSGNALYGTTFRGGTNNNGTVFALALRLAPAPELTLGTSSSGLVISWPANAPGFILQSTTDLGPTGSWTPVSTKPVLMNGVNIVTNAFSATQQFFRLSQ